ncbi:MAG TPA: type VI secretion system tube protein Hcp [Gemmatimonadaceae bacterium]|jgi:type VI secretion system secreted protein Hcp
MAFDAFLKLDDLKGESLSKHASGWIEIQSFSWGASNPTTIGHGAGGGSGKASVSGMNIMKRTDSTSPVLFQNCCSGTHFKKGTMTLFKAGGKEPVEYLKYEFTEVFVDSVQWSGSSGGDDVPTESVSFAFGKVDMTYTPQKADGSKGTAVVASWDLKLNAAK